MVRLGSLRKKVVWQLSEFQMKIAHCGRKKK